MRLRLLVGFLAVWGFAPTLANGQLAEDAPLPATDVSTIASAESHDNASSNLSSATITGDCGCGQDGCGASCCDDECCCDDRLLGFIRRSDRCFTDFISPMTNPVFFEDPRNLTEARVIFIHHRIPPALGSDNVDLVAMQLRAALTDRLSLIATKDGFISNDSPLLNDGWADVAAGLKYNLYANHCTQTLLSGGATFELPVGSTRALQGNGDGEFNLFVTGGTQLGDWWHFVSAAGVRLPADTTAENQVAYWSNHLDRRLWRDDLYFLVEANWYHWMQSGNDFPLPVEGGDLFNLGAQGVAGNEIVAAAFGLKFKPNEVDEIGIAFEFPVTDRRGLIDNRLTVDYILRY